MSGLAGRESDVLQVWDGKQWLLRARMPAPRWDAACVVHAGRMMVIGGFIRGEGISASVISYDPETDTWSKGEPLPPTRPYFTTEFSAVTHAGGIHVVCGGAPLRYCDDRWSELPKIPTPPTGELFKPALASVLLG